MGRLFIRADERKRPRNVPLFWRNELDSQEREVAHRWPGRAGRGSGNVNTRAIVSAACPHFAPDAARVKHVRGSWPGRKTHAATCHLHEKLQAIYLHIWTLGSIVNWSRTGHSPEPLPQSGPSSWRSLPACRCPGSGSPGRRARVL